MLTPRPADTSPAKTARARRRAHDSEPGGGEKIITTSSVATQQARPNPTAGHGLPLGLSSSAADAIWRELLMADAPTGSSEGSDPVLNSGVARFGFCSVGGEPTGEHNRSDEVSYKDHGKIYG